MQFALIVVVSVAFSLACVLGWLWLKSKRSLERFRDISDLDAYRVDAERAAQEAKEARDQARSEIVQSEELVEKLKQQVSQYQQVVADFKSAAELKKYINDMNRYAQGCKTLGELSAKIQHQTALYDQLIDDVKKMGYAVDSASAAGSLIDQVAEKQKELTHLRKEIMQVEEVKEMQEFGFYRRRYEFDSSEQYKNTLDKVRSRQKEMIKSKTAATCDTEWTVQGSKTKGRKMINDKIKLLLRAFNGESDAAIAKVSYSNATSMEGRIERSYEQITKMGEVNQVRISRQYLELKLEELFLAHEYQLAKQEENEEKKRIKQQMKEEAKVEKEIEKAKQEAEQEELAKLNALEQARAELKEKEGQQTEKLGHLVAKLERELQEALDRKAKAIARAQLTKSGHVYVLSNIGSFGEGVYKIGMTRRLEPLERVKELGSASVPFLFDVHAMIFSKNAPELESKLHAYFDDRRVNFVNCRKEFFRVPLNEIHEAVSEIFGEVTFATEPQADEYRQTVARLAESTTEEYVPQDSLEVAAG